MDDYNMNRWPGKVERFNRNYPVGTPVVVTRSDGKRLTTEITHPAVILSNGYPVVWVKGIIGFYRLDRVIIT